MDCEKVKQRRAMFNFVYQEIMSFEDPERGLPFDRVLKVLAYKLIDVERYLKYALIFNF